MFLNNLIPSHFPIIGAISRTILRSIRNKIGDSEFNQASFPPRSLGLSVLVCSPITFKCGFTIALFCLIIDELLSH